MERRASQRHKCRLDCELWVGGRKLEATVVDASRGGLGIHVEHPIDQGESLRVAFAPGGKPVELEVLVWRVRSARRSGDAAPRYALGTVLCEPPPEYLELVDAGARGLVAGRRSEAPRRGRSKPAGASSRVGPAPEPPGPAERTFRVRARSGSNRTRMLHVDAASPEQARTRAGAALGQDWSVLEIEEDSARR
jgi:hypothetical protein